MLKWIRDVPSVTSSLRHEHSYRHHHDDIDNSLMQPLHASPARAILARSRRIKGNEVLLLPLHHRFPLLTRTKTRDAQEAVEQMRPWQVNPPRFLGGVPSIDVPTSCDCSAARVPPGITPPLLELDKSPKGARRCVHLWHFVA